MISVLSKSFLLSPEMSFYQFTNEFGERYGSCRIFKMDRFDLQDSDILLFEDGEWFSYDYFQGKIYVDPADFEGWYWQAGFPGCLPDGDLMGPFKTESEAMQDAGVFVD